MKEGYILINPGQFAGGTEGRLSPGVVALVGFLVFFGAENDSSWMPDIRPAELCASVCTSDGLLHAACCILHRTASAVSAQR